MGVFHVPFTGLCKNSPVVHHRVDWRVNPDCLDGAFCGSGAPGWKNPPLEGCFPAGRPRGAEALRYACEAGLTRLAAPSVWRASASGCFVTRKIIPVFHRSPAFCQTASHLPASMLPLLLVYLSTCLLASLSTCLLASLSTCIPASARYLSRNSARQTNRPFSWMCQCSQPLQGASSM